MVLPLLLLLMAINDWWCSMIDGDDADEWWSVLINDDQCLTSMIINDDQCWSSIMINDDDQWRWLSLMMVKLQIILILLTRRPRPDPSEATEGLGGVAKAAYLSHSPKRGLDTVRIFQNGHVSISGKSYQISQKLHESLQFLGIFVHGILPSFRRYSLSLNWALEGEVSVQKDDFQAHVKSKDILRRKTRGTLHYTSRSSMFDGFVWYIFSCWKVVVSNVQILQMFTPTLRRFLILDK